MNVRKTSEKLRHVNMHRLTPTPYQLGFNDVWHNKGVKTNKLRR